MDKHLNSIEQWLNEVEDVSGLLKSFDHISTAERLDLAIRCIKTSLSEMYAEYQELRKEALEITRQNIGLVLKRELNTKQVKGDNQEV